MMRLAFYIAATGGMLDKAIDACSGSYGFSHVEIVFSDGMFFSSSGVDGGVRFKRIAPKPDHWRFYDLTISRSEESSIRQWCLTQEGKRYDWLGVLGFVLPTHHLQARWFCSEIVIAALQQGGNFQHLRPWKVSPNNLVALAESACWDEKIFSESDTEPLPPWNKPVAA